MDVARHWRQQGAYYRLEGVRCEGCQMAIFPPRDVCPSCQSETLAPHRFAGRGVIHSHARVFNPPDGFEAQAPYDVALVRLDEGPLVTARLTDFGDDEVRIGAPVEAVTRRLDADGPEGVIRYAYAFRPRLDA